MAFHLAADGTGVCQGGGGVGRGNDENKILWSGGGDGSRGNF